MTSFNEDPRDLLTDAAREGWRVLFCPALRSLEGAQLLLDAFAMLDSGRQVRLCITGCAAVRDKLPEMVRVRELDGKVCCQPDPGNGLLQMLYSGSDLVIVTDVNPYGAELEMPEVTVVQAINSGRKVVAPEGEPNTTIVKALSAGTCYVTGEKTALAEAILEQLDNLPVREQV